MATWLTCAGLAAPATAAPASATAPSQDAKAYLSEALRQADAGKVAAVLLALRSTKDKELIPLFTALSRSGDRNRRVFACEALMDLAGAEAAPVLLERLKTDPEKTIRSKALVQLLDLQAIAPADLREAVKDPDEGVRCFAARGLVRAGQGKEAVEVLRKLASSQDQAVSAMARMGLLATGEQDQLPVLRKLVGDPGASGVVIGLLMEQAAEAKVAAAKELAEAVAASTREGPLRLRACEAIAAVAPDGSSRLRQAIEQSQEMVFQTYLLNVLAGRADARPHLEALAKRGDSPGALARLELARADLGPGAGKAAGEVVALGHPVLLEYLLNRVKEDLARRPAGSDFGELSRAGAYAPALLKYVQSFPPEGERMGPEHNRLAVAAALLADIGTPEAVAGLRKLLEERYNPRQRAVAAGLRWSKNPAACDLMRPLLESPYSELSEDAALLLGRFADRGAAGPLDRILLRRQSNPAALVTLAAWYLLKIAGSSASTVQELVRESR